MFDERGGVAVQEGPRLVDSPLPDYRRCVKTLNRTGIVSLLPRTEQLGVVGLDGQEYPIPTPAEIENLFKRNKELVEAKAAQGFTRLQLTPFAVPLAVLKERTRAAILKHDAEGRIFQAKHKSTDPDTRTAVDRNEPIWMWDQITSGDQDGKLVYFPKAFGDKHQGLAKKDIVKVESGICAVPGWSVALVENLPILPQEGKGKTLGGRKQIETHLSPNDYLKMLSSTPYQQETGLTPEDFLTDFLTRLEETNQVSHDWNDNSALWLTGTYLPSEGCVPVGDWDRGIQRLGLAGSVPGDRGPGYGAASTVRLKL